MRCLVCVLGFALGLAVVLPAQTEPEVRSIELNGRLIRYEVRAGFAVVQGDIIIGYRCRRGSCATVFHR